MWAENQIALEKNYAVGSYRSFSVQLVCTYLRVPLYIYLYIYIFILHLLGTPDDTVC